MGHPSLFTVVVFVVLLVLLPQDGGGNEAARLATMAALTTEGTFALTNYPWTQDWALSPTTGKTYANKPPLPAVIGAPLYWIVDQFVQFWQPPFAAVRRAVRYERRLVYGKLISVVLQVLPFAWLASLSGKWLVQAGAPPPAVQFGVVAILFGSTASLFMNTYFGHGFAAVLVLAATLLFFQRRYAASSLLLGSAALSDYGAALLVPPWLVALIVREQRQALRAGGRAAVGLVLPALLWAAYHWSVFGHPLYIATRYANPDLYSAAVQYPVWGLFSTAVNFGVLRELLVGTHRGLLFSQPWILVTACLSLAWLPRRDGWRVDFISLLFLSIGGLSLLLLANSSYNSWQGGWTAGPRFVSSILPVFGLVAALAYTFAWRSIRFVLWVTLAVSIMLFVIAYSTTVLAEEAPLWPFYWRVLREAIHQQPMVVLKSVALLGVIAVASWADVFIQRRLADCMRLARSLPFR